MSLSLWRPIKGKKAGLIQKRILENWKKKRGTLPGGRKGPQWPEKKRPYLEEHPRRNLDPLKPPKAFGDHEKAKHKYF